MKVILGADHGGLELKNKLHSRLADKYEVIDVGANVFNATDDYPDFARAVAEAIVTPKADRGILICGSGVGACIAANKVPGIYACLCHDTYSAHQGVEHDNMNVLCLGARVIGIELACELAGVFLEAKIHDEERLRRRFRKVQSMERQMQ